MKAEPLKDKRQDCNEIQSLDYEGKVVEFFEEKDIKSAVEWLKERPYTRYDEDSEDGEVFFDIMIIKKSDFDKAFADVIN